MRSLAQNSAPGKIHFIVLEFFGEQETSAQNQRVRETLPFVLYDLIRICSFHFSCMLIESF